MDDNLIGNSFYIYLISFLVLSCNFACSEERYAEELNSKAIKLYSQGRYNDAIRVGEKALKVAEETYGPDNPSTATSLSNLAEYYYANGEYKKVAPFLRRAIKIIRLDRGDFHPSVALPINLLARVYDAQGNYAEAEPLYLKALAIWEKAYGKNDTLFVIPVLGKIAAVYEKQGKGDAVKKIRKRIKSSTSNTDKREELIAKRDSLISRGNYNEAEKAGEKVVVLTEEIFGKDHIFVALDLDELAKIYKAQNRFDKVEPVYKRELEIWKKTRGLDHPRTIETMKNLMITYEKLGNIENMREIEDALRKINKKR